MIIKGAKRKVAAPKKVEEPAAAPKKERKARKVVTPVVVEPEIVEEIPAVEETVEIKDEE